MSNPNTLRFTRKNTTSYIENFEGISEVDIYCPNMRYPLLPFRYDNKLLFPTGNFTGYYTHVELRKAMELGYIIKEVKKTYYFKDICFPFKNYVTDLYELRKKLKKQNNPMEYVIKILMNSLYGKFGQKFLNKDNWIPIPETLEELEQYDFIERHGNFMRIKMDFTEPRPFCIPIWASYVTAYGRLKLHEWILRSNPVYYDTDSIITKKHYEDSDALGKLKLEHKIKMGVIVKPKFYGFLTDKGEELVRIKGFGRRMDFNELLEFVQTPVKTYDKFMKFKESVRRGFIPNEIQTIQKSMSLEDNKRIWENTFSYRYLQDSTPRNITKEIIQSKPLNSF